MEGTTNVAARAGRWSARHRGKAIVGWLVFVVLAVFVGGSIGTEQIADEDQSVGEAREADHAVADAFPDNADETVLIQSAGGGQTADQPAFRAVVDDVVAKLEATENVVDVESPYFAGSEGAISRDGRSALVTLEIPDPGEDSDVTTEDLVEAPLAVVERLGEAHPGFRIEEFGDASANKQLSESFEDDFRRAEVTSLP
ncbi:MAG TPA: MMPL family transporter, partial [Solirubrobacterales bacterium]